jgi:hypothetical protein
MFQHFEAWTHHAVHNCDTIAATVARLSILRSCAPGFGEQIHVGQKKKAPDAGAFLEF